jgi:hypothetical protein
MPTQSEMGKAFEYAVLSAFYNVLSEDQPVSVIDNTSFKVAKKYYASIDEAAKQKMNTAAKAAFKHIVRLEPQLKTPAEYNPLKVPSSDLCQLFSLVLKANNGSYLIEKRA